MNNMSEKLLKQILNELKEMKSELKEVKSEQQATRQDISNIQKTMATKEDVADIPAIKVSIFETSEIVKHIETTQVRHERTLDLLSRRSIDQEAEIKRIK